MGNKFFWSFLFIIVIFLVGFFLFGNFTKVTRPEVPVETIVKTANVKFVKIKETSIKVDLALTPTEQNLGLSRRTSLDQNDGMLFVFDRPGKYPFWMKEMNFPIDIIWIGEDLKVVYIKKNASPESYPETFGPGENDQDAKYVLEVVSGSTDKSDLKIGDEVDFIY